MNANEDIGDWRRDRLAWYDRLKRAISEMVQHSNSTRPVLAERLRLTSGQPPTSGGSDDPGDDVDSETERRGGQTRAAWTPLEVEKLFSSPDRVRFLYVIAGHPDRQLTAEEICDIGGLEPSTFTQHRDVLLEFGIIERGESEGDETTFRLNRDHPVARGFGRHR